MIIKQKIANEPCEKTCNLVQGYMQNVLRGSEKQRSISSDTFRYDFRLGCIIFKTLVKTNFYGKQTKKNEE